MGSGESSTNSASMSSQDVQGKVKGLSHNSSFFAQRAAEH